MRSFGKNFEKIEELKACTESVGEKDLLTFDHSDEEQAKMDNIMVPCLENNTYEYSKKTEKPKEEKAVTEGIEDIPQELQKEEEDVVVTTAPAADDPQLEKIGLKKKEGAAGNSTKDKKPEPQMGAIGGLNFKKECGLADAAIQEGFNPSDVVDDTSMEIAKHNAQENVIERVKNVFNDVFDDKFTKAKKKEYDLDSTILPIGGIVSSNKFDKVPKEYKLMPKGW